MKIKDAERLVKLLELMASDHDGEALAAARKASHFLKEKGLRWSQVLMVEVEKPQEKPAPPSHPAAQQPAWPTPNMNAMGAAFYTAEQMMQMRQSAQQAAMASAYEQSAYNPYSQYQQQRPYNPQSEEIDRIRKEMEGRQEKKKKGKFDWFK